MMNKEFKDLIEKVFLPATATLLSSGYSMDDLSSVDFEEYLAKYLDSYECKTDKALHILEDYLLDDEVSLEDQLKVIKTFSGNPQTQLIYVDGLCPGIHHEYITIEDLNLSLPSFLEDKVLARMREDLIMEDLSAIDELLGYSSLSKEESEKLQQNIKAAGVDKYAIEIFAVLKSVDKNYMEGYL